MTMKRVAMIVSLCAGVACVAVSAASAATTVGPVTFHQLAVGDSVTIPSNASSYFLSAGQVTFGSEVNPNGIVAFGGYSTNEDKTYLQTLTDNGPGPTINYAATTSSEIWGTDKTNGGNGYAGNFLYVPVLASATQKVVNVVFGYDTGNPVASTDGAKFLVNGVNAGAPTLVGNSGRWVFGQYTFTLSSDSGDVWANVELHGLTAYGDTCQSTISAVWLTPPAATFLPGDADKNGVVDDNDLNALLSAWGTGTTWAEGNFKGTGTTDDNDLNALLSNWGKTSGAAVPEPVTMSLLAIGGLALLRRKA